MDTKDAGKHGGQKRAEKMTPEQRSEAAKKAATESGLFAPYPADRKLLESRKTSFRKRRRFQMRARRFKAGKVTVVSH